MTRIWCDHEGQTSLLCRKKVRRFYPKSEVTHMECSSDVFCVIDEFELEYDAAGSHQPESDVCIT